MKLLFSFISEKIDQFQQVRDELRTDYDPGRGGYGKFASPEAISYRYPEETSKKRGQENLGGGSSYTKRPKREGSEEKNPRFREGKDDSEDEAN